MGKLCTDEVQTFPKAWGSGGESSGGERALRSSGKDGRGRGGMREALQQGKWYQNRSLLLPGRGAPRQAFKSVLRRAGKVTGRAGGRQRALNIIPDGITPAATRLLVMKCPERVFYNLSASLGPCAAPPRNHKLSARIHGGHKTVTVPGANEVQMKIRVPQVLRRRAGGTSRRGAEGLALGSWFCWS